VACHLLDPLVKGLLFSSRREDVNDDCFRMGSFSWHCDNPFALQPNQGCRLLMLILVYMASTFFLDQPALAQDDSGLVSFYVSVFDKQGKPVEDLTQAKFEILEDGKQQTIRSVHFEKATPVSLGILIDVSRSMGRERTDMALSWVKSLAERLKSPDEIFINSFSDDSQEVIDFAAPEDYLEEAATHLSTGGQSYTGLAVDRGLIKLRDSKNKKRVLLLVSAGLDKAGPATLEHIARFRCPIYALNLRGSGGATGALDKLKSLSMKGTALKVYADQSGGNSVLVDSSNEAERALDSLFYDLKNQYRLDYVSSNSKKDGKLRRVELKIMGGDYDMRYLRKYQAPRR
jgi:VWFA-related protein